MLGTDLQNQDADRVQRELPRMSNASGESPSAPRRLVERLKRLVPELYNSPLTDEEILAIADGSSKNDACGVADQLQELWPVVLRHSQDPVMQMGTAIIDYLMDHADAVRNTDAGRTYSDGFRRLVLSLVEPGQPGADMSFPERVRITGVAEDVLRNWLHTRGGPDRPVSVHQDPD